MAYCREEDEADRWLREHDPYYTDHAKNKQKKLKYPYDTPQQEKRKAEAEVPLSNLNSYQMYKASLVLGCYGEDNEFSL